MSDYSFLDFSDDHLAEWRTRAACRGQSELFFPTFNESASSFDARVKRCKNVCDGCKVKPECREWAFRSPDEGIDLVLGGRSYKERLKSLNRKNRWGRGK